jgi:hypothetical protein
MDSLSKGHSGLTRFWRRLFDDIASGKLSVVNRPDKRVRDFQAKLQRPMIEQRQKTADSQLDGTQRARPIAAGTKAACRWHPAAWRTRGAG